MELIDLSWKEAKKAFKKAELVILPLGAIEAHGFHLPMSTDTIVAEEMSKRIAERIDSLILPALHYNVIWELRKFPHIRVEPDTLKRLIVDIGRSILSQGARRFLIIYGHGQRFNQMEEISWSLREEGLNTLAVLPWPTDADEIRKAKKGATTHADELETSILLALKPEKVKMEKAIIDYPKIPGYRVTYPKPLGEFSKTAVFGDSKSATKEKGEKLIKLGIENTIQLIKEVFPKIVIRGGISNGRKKIADKKR